MSVLSRVGWNHRGTHRSDERSSRVPLVIPVTLAILLAAQGPSDRLAAFLAAHPPAAPWLAVDAQHVRAKASAADLAAFSRRAVPVGRMIAVVPMTMVTVEEPKAEANVYDGLPREAKVLALMAALTPGQWARLGGTGLGLNDLQGEPRAILASLLPSPLRYERLHKSGGVLHEGQTERLSLPEGDQGGVRLRLRRDLVLSVHKPGEEGTMNLGFDHSDVRDGTYARLDERAEKDSGYGLAIRQTVPNRPKPGALRLDDTTLDVSVALPATTTVREALALASKATGRTVVADLRVSGLPVVGSGGAVRAGDLLGSLALAVTGTYRAVGPGFELATDLAGQGARKARIDRWAMGVSQSTKGREAAWRRAIAAGGGMRSVGYPPGAVLRADDDLQRRIDAHAGEYPPPDVAITVPLFVAQGDIDTLVRPQDTRDFANTECSAGVNVTYVSIPKTGHGLVAFRAISTLLPWFARIVSGDGPTSTC